MRQSEYDLMNRVEARMWWYRGLHRLLADTVHRRVPGARRGLDGGCGTGGLLRVLGIEGRSTQWFGIEIDSQAAKMAQAKSSFAIAAASIEVLPFAAGSFDVVISADVLSHALVSPPRALDELHRVLVPGGCLVLNLPAYRWLLSRHDKAVQNVRRFTAGQARAMLAAHGFVETRCSYWNTLLFPLMAVSRLLPRFGLARGDAKSDVMEYPAWLDAIFSAALAGERVLLRWGAVLPFGGSIVVTALKK